MRRLPPFAAIRVFEAAARHENFTSAGGELGMSQAAVSYQVKILEDALGVPLFLRARGRVTLAEAGAQLATQVSSAFDLLDDAFGRIREEDASTLNISSFVSFSTLWLASRLGTFQLGQPGIAVSLNIADGLSDFARDNIDVAIRGGLGNWPGLHSQFLMRISYAPMASPDFVAAHGPFDSAQQIADSRRLNADDRWWMRWLGTFGVIDPPPAPAGIRLDSQTTEGSATLAGQGIALLNPVFWQEELRDGRLIQLGELVLSRSSLWVICPEHKRNLPKIKMFRDWLVAEADKDPMRDTIRVPPPSEDPAKRD